MKSFIPPPLTLFVVVSATVHVLLLSTLGRDIGPRAEKKTVKVKIVAATPPPPTPTPVATPPPAPTPKPTPPPPTPKPTPKPRTQAKPKDPVPEATPVQGFSKDSLTSNEGSGPSVPVGNTLMVEDQGIRKDDVKPFAGDLSRDPILKQASVVKPEYTDEAIDAGLQGSFRVDILLDEQGNVQDAQLQKPVGYGMDRRILDSVRNLKYEPRLDKFGKALGGWTVVEFSLQLP
jgi:protein TonB